jgi:hypothetical protein
MTGRQIEPRFSSNNQFIRFNRVKKTGYRYWTMNFSVTTTTNSVPVEQIEAYREFIGEIHKESSWSLILPVGSSRTKAHRNFGQLPIQAPKTSPVQSTSSLLAGAVPTPLISSANIADVSPQASPISSGMPESPSSPRPTATKGRRRHRHRDNKFPLWMKIAGIFILVLMIVILFVVLQKQ